MGLASIAVSIDTDHATLRHHVNHDYGISSWQIQGPEGRWAQPTIYLRGTPDQLRDFAQNILDAADEYDLALVTL